MFTLQLSYMMMINLLNPFSNSTIVFCTFSILAKPYLEIRNGKLYFLYCNQSVFHSVLHLFVKKKYQILFQKQGYF